MRKIASYLFTGFAAACILYTCEDLYRLSVAPSMPVIDLPEEWQAMSKESSKADTLTGFFNNDTLYIQFK